MPNRPVSDSRASGPNRVADLGRNAFARIIRAGGGLLLVGSLLAVSQLHFARVAEAQTQQQNPQLRYAVYPRFVRETAETARITVVHTGEMLRSIYTETKDGTAKAGTNEDYTAVSRQQHGSQNPGWTTTVEIAINNDIRQEGEEYFILSVSGIDYRIQIIDDDEYTLSPTSFKEDADRAIVKVTYRGTGTGNPRFETRDGTAVAPGDYMSRNFRLFPSMSDGEERNATITTIRDDSDKELDEHFFVNVSGMDHRITIEDNDALYTVTSTNAVASTSTSFSFRENVGTARLVISNVGSSTATPVFSTKDGTAKAGTGNDYTHAFPPLTPPASGHGVEIPIRNDNVREGDEHFFLTVDGVDYRIIILDGSPAPTVTASSGGGNRVNEGAGSYVYTITLAANPPIISNVTVRCWTRYVGSSADGGQDYLPVDETLTWAPSEFPSGTTSVSKTCTIPIIDDRLDETSTEIINVRIGELTGGAVSSGANNTDGTWGINLIIEDNDAPPVMSVSAATTTVSETAATIEVVVNLSSAVGKDDLAIGYRLSGTATAGYGAMANSGEDYAVSYVIGNCFGGTSASAGDTIQGTLNYIGRNTMEGSGQIVFCKGESSKSFTIHLENDQLKELTETIVFELQDSAATQNGTNVDDATPHPTDSSVTMYLLSDETGIVSLTSADTKFVEGGNARILAELDLDGTASGRSGGFDVTVVGSGDTADAGDHGTIASTVTVAEGAPTAIDIPLTADGTPEPDETLTVTVTESNDSSHTASVTFTVVDDGNPPQVTLPGGAEPRGEEGGAVEFAVTYEPPGTPSNRSETFAVTVEPGTAEAGDYGAPSMTSVALEEGTPQTIRVPVVEDDLNELDETFFLVLTGQGSPGGTSAEMRLRATIDGTGDVVILRLRTPDGPSDRLRIEEGGGPGEEGPVTATFEVELDLDGTPSGRSATFEVGANEGTAKAGEDYALPASTTLILAEGGTPQTFAVEVLDDEESESAEYFDIVLQGASGTSASFEFRTYIDDNDGPDPLLREIGRHAVARTEALIENQPRLIPMLRNPGARTSEFLLRASDRGVDAAVGGFQAEIVWGEATLSRAVDGHGEHEHLLATLGAHARMSDRLHLGGMLQYDRTGTKPGGEVDSGEIRGAGWMAGPYFAFRDASHPLFFEGRLLFGRATSDVDALVIDGDAPRSASVDSERWLVQARVEGTYRFDGGATLIPLADFSHARDAMGAFSASDDPGEMLEAQTIALSKLQIGAELEIPVATVRGDLRFRPGLRFVVSDANAGAWAAEEEGRIGLRSRGRIDFGVDYRLEDGLFLGFQSFYSGLGRKELESYGAGLDLRMEF